MTAEVLVPDASCGHCKSTIETKISTLEGISSVDLDLDTKRLTVEHGGSLSDEDLLRAIRDAGYTPELLS